MTLKRTKGWEDRFTSLVQSRLREPFAWGGQDCCLWAADCVQALTGIDPAESLRGTYSTALEAARIVTELGGLEAIVTAALGEPLGGPLFASVGDIGIVETNGRQSLAVCNGAHWLAPSDGGMVPVPLELAATAWRV